MSRLTEAQVLEQLRTVKDPELNRDLVSLEMIKGIHIDDGRVRLRVELTTPACPHKEMIQNDVTAALQRIPGFSIVEIEFTARVRGNPAGSGALPDVKNIVAVGAGKGGVGKSTASVLLAVGLQRAGAKVGLLDADIYGPSIPTLMGLEGERPMVNGQRIVPLISNGVKVMSMGFLISREQAVVWRGPMVHGAVKQFLEQVEWGELDYLIVDLPPGTGDVPLTLAQAIPMTGAVIICTPQDVALSDARRAIKMYEQLKVGCLGIIENMSYYLCPHCGQRDEIFDHGGAALAAKDMDVPFLGEIPLNARVRVFGDAGTPEKTFTDSDGYVREAVERVVRNVAGRISVANAMHASAPTLTVE